MKVLWLAQHPIPSSKIIHPVPWISSLAKALTEKGIKIDVLTSNTKLKEKHKVYQMDGYRLIALRSLSGYIDMPIMFRDRIGRIERYIRNINGYDAIHVHGTEYQLGTSLIKAGTHIPAVVSIQGIINEYKKVIPKKLNYKRFAWDIFSYYERQELRYFRNFSCRTHWDKGIVRSFNPAATIFNIWEILRGEFYDAHIAKPGKNVLFTGGANPIKALWRALQLFNSLLKHHSAVLHITGNCDWKVIQGYVEQYGLHNIKPENIRLHGMVGANQLIALYRDSAFMLHTSLMDNSPNSICESQVSGLPVVSTNVGGVSSLIRHGETGLLLGDDELLNEAQLLEFYTDEIGRKRISDRARTEATQRHNVDTIVSDTINMYQTLHS